MWDRAAYTVAHRPPTSLAACAEGVEMCRLFGMHAGTVRVDATFWLEDAPDSLSVQSRMNPDGFGIGTFAPDGRPIVEKEPRPAWEASGFDKAAHEFHGTVFIAHVRKASTGALEERNTHPFLQDGRLFAHNGVVQGLDELDARLSELGVSDLVKGDTDSERMFALITAETRRHDGDIEAGIGDAIGWIGQNLPVFSVNFVLTTPTDLWALRYPASHDLFLLERPAPTDEAGPRPLRSNGTHMSAHSDTLSDQPSILVATERMDGESGWRDIDAGALIHVGTDLSITTTKPFPSDPVHLLTLEDLNATEAQSQRP